MTDLSTSEALPRPTTIHRTILDPRPASKYPAGTSSPGTCVVSRGLIIPLEELAARTLVIWTAPELPALVCPLFQDGLLHGGEVTETAS